MTTLASQYSSEARAALARCYRLLLQFATPQPPADQEAGQDRAIAEATPDAAICATRPNEAHTDEAPA